MTHDPRFPIEDFEEEPVDVEVAKNPGAIIQIRFSKEEVQELCDEERATNTSLIDLIHDQALAAIRANRRKREAGQAEVAD